MSPKLPFLAAALLASATPSPAAEPQAPAATTQETPAPFAVGDPFPTEGLPTTWLRGEPIKSLAPGTTYVIVLWNTRGIKAAPGHNITRALRETGENPRLKALVLFANDDIDRDRLQRRLNYPSNQNNLPLADATAPDSPTARLWLPHITEPNLNTIVVRDSKVLWIGNGFELSANTLKPFLTEEFDFDQYTKEKTENDAHLRELVTLIGKEYPQADEERAEEILAELQAEKDLHPFIGMRLHDALFQRAVSKKDIPGALSTMQAMVDAYPDEESVHSWAYKVINSSEPVLQPGQAQAARAAAKVAELRNDRQSPFWWQAAAEHYLNAGDKQAALKALEAAEKSTPTYQKLQQYRSAIK